MATLTLKGANRTVWASDVPSTKIPVGQDHGKVHWKFDSYSWATDSVIGDVVTLMKIPKGATIVDAIVKANDHGSAGQYDLGYAASAEVSPGTTTPLEAAVVDAFFNEFNPEGTGGNAASLGGGGLAAGTGIGAIAPGAALFKQFLAEVDVQITVTEASNVGSGVNIKFGVAYVID